MDSEGETTLASRVERTLAIMHRWGYAPTVDALNDALIGGAVPPESLLLAVEGSDTIRRTDGFVVLRGWERLIGPSRRRVDTHRRLNARVRETARAFATDLARFCPFVEAIALSGSVASGGYEEGDDIDFDLFVEAGTKYTCYLLATLIGLKYAWKHRGVEMNEFHRTPLLPKITCVNVVWPADETRPFVRQDENVAFELLRCQPLVGAHRFHEVIRDNPWLREYFPQLDERIWLDPVSVASSPLAGLAAFLRRHPRLLRIVERSSRSLSWIMYRTVQSYRGRDPEARARMDFLRRVKYPYEVFQD